MNEVDVLKALRGIAAGTAMAAALTACGSSGGGSATGATGGQPTAPIVFAPDQIRTALVSKAGAPKGWKGSEPKVDLDNGMRTCEEDTKSSCGGFVAVGWSHISPTNGDGSGRVEFHLYSFRSSDDAKAAMKGLAAEERRSAGANGVEIKQLQISAGADETDAFTGQRTRIMMRVGGLVVFVKSQGSLSGEQPYGDLAKLQIGRIKKTAERKNPDA
ncbi:hypothetical protein ACFY2M_37885 [Streptomyces sp. NPDC001276]|uniref:hypothetical protein n=1 Tax=Streptomyces sp. NPDC001276 TaxID=3364555 RepID=UPI00368F980A